METEVIEQPQAPVANQEPTEESLKEYAVSKGFVLKTQAEIQKEVDAAVGNTHRDWESQLSSAFGQAKPDGVKGLDWAKTQITDLKTPKPEQSQPSTSSDVEKAKNDSVIKSMAERIERLEREKEQEKAARIADKISTERMLAIKSLKLKADSPEELESRQLDAETLFKAKVELKLDDTGKVVPYVNGSPAIDPATQEPYKLEKLAKEKLSYLLAEEKPVVTGTGTVPQATTKVVNGKTVMAVAASSQDIFTEAAKQGLITGSKEWQEFVSGSAEASKITI